MRLVHHRIERRLSVWKALSLLLSLALLSSPASTQSYTVTDLGDLCGSFCRQADPGVDASEAWDINDRGQVVGWTTLRYAGGRGITNIRRAFLWENGVMRELGTIGMPTNPSHAYGINARGQVVGEVSVGNTVRAFIWTATDGMKPLGALGSRSTARRINGRGEAVGGYWMIYKPGDGRPRACIFRDGKEQDLGFWGWAEDINEAGHVAATELGPILFTAPILWKEGVLVRIPFPGYHPGADALNDRDEVVGLGESPSKDHAALYSGGVVKDLGTLGGDSRAYGINDAGTVVGWSEVSGDGSGHAFVYRDGHMFDLNDLIPTGSSLVLRQARAINNAGQIVGVGSYNRSYTPPFASPSRAFLLTPR